MKRVIKAQEQHDSAGAGARPLDLLDIDADVRRIVGASRAEAEGIVAEARRRAASILQDAQRRGYAEGLSRGRAEGAAEGRRAAEEKALQHLHAGQDELLALARKTVDELAAAKAQLLQQARGELLELAVELARKIVARVAATDVEAARANLQKALELAEAAGELAIHVNPGQKADLERRLPELAEMLHVRGRVTLVADERISAGGVRLLCGPGEIDATIETQLANVVEALLGPGGDSTRASESEEKFGETDNRV